MTVRELIQELRKLPPDYVVRDSDGDEIDTVRTDDLYEEVVLEY